MMTFATPERPSAPEMSVVPIERLSIWRGTDFKSPGDFAHRLSETDVTEIDAAVRAVAEIDPIAIGKHNFVLPQLGTYLTQIRDDLLRGRGFLVLRGLPVERWSIEQTAAAFLGIGAYFGKPVSQNGKGHILGHVKDSSAEASMIRPPASIRQRTDRPSIRTWSISSRCCA